MTNELVAWGIQAYKEHDFESAIGYLERANRSDWIGQLYLAMSYYMAQRKDEAQTLFSFIRDQCPDTETRSKAETAFVALRSQQLRETREQREHERKESELEIEFD